MGQGVPAGLNVLGKIAGKTLKKYKFLYDESIFPRLDPYHFDSPAFSTECTMHSTALSELSSFSSPEKSVNPPYQEHDCSFESLEMYSEFIIEA